MPDAPAPAPAPKPKKKPANRAVLSKAQGADLAKALKVCNAIGTDPDNGPLFKRGITADRVSSLRENIAATRAKANEALAASRALDKLTKSERAKRTALLEAIRGVQSVAKQKFARTNRDRLKDFLVGTDLGGDRREDLETHSQGVLDALAGNPLADAGLSDRLES